MDCNQRYKSVTEYVNEFYRLGAQLNLAEPEVQRVSKFLSGLKDTIRDELSMNTIWTMHDAINLAKKAKTKLVKQQSRVNYQRRVQS